MATIPDWLLGKHLTACTITPQTVAAGGALTAGTASDILVVVDQVTVNSDVITEDIRPVKSQLANNVRTGLDASIDVTIILRPKSGSIVANPLASLAFAASNNEVCVFTFTRGSSVFAMTGTMCNISDGVTSHGKNTATMNIKQLDDGAGSVYTP